MKKLSAAALLLLLACSLAQAIGVSETTVLGSANPAAAAPGTTLSTVILSVETIVSTGVKASAVVLTNYTANFGSGITCGTLETIRRMKPGALASGGTLPLSITGFKVYNVVISSAARKGIREVVVSNDIGEPVARGSVFGVADTSGVAKIAYTKSSMDPVYRPEAMIGLSFPTERIGYGVGPWNEMWKTTNRGVTWTKSQLLKGTPPDGLYRIFTSVCFPTAQTGYAGGIYLNGVTADYKPYIIKTTDGGTTWAETNLTDYATVCAVTDLYFADENTGWAVNSYLGMSGMAKNLFRTTDGGASWQTGGIVRASSAGSVGAQLKVLPDYLSLIGITAVPNSGGKYDVWAVGAPWAITGTNMIFKSTDSGATWAVQDSTAFSAPADARKVYLITDVDFVDNNTGYVTGVGIVGFSPVVSSLYGKVFKTTDGGTTWTQLATGMTSTPALLGVDFADANNGVVVGAYGTMLKTADGGATWTQYWRDSRHLRGVVCKDANNVWTCGGTMFPGIPLLWAGALPLNELTGGILPVIGSLNAKNLNAKNLGYDPGTAPNLASLTANAIKSAGTSGDYMPVNGYNDGPLGVKFVLDPTVTAVVPGEGNAGATDLTLTVSGANLQSGATVDFGTGVTASAPSLTSDSGSSALVNVNIDAAAGTGARDVTWTNEDWGSAVVSSGFSILPPLPTTTTTGTNKMTIRDVTPSKETLGKGLDIAIYMGADNTVAPTRVTLISTRTGRTMTFTTFTYRDGVVTLPSIPSAEINPNDVGYWNVRVEGPGASAMAPRPILIDLGGEGNVVVTPNTMGEQTFRALAAGETPSRMAYTLAGDKAVNVYIIELKEGKTVYHRAYSAGNDGGKSGYNEQVLSLKTDLGGTFPNGVYLIQVVANGKVIGTAKFVVNKIS
ncbi:MAG: hypothetical protein WC529_05390 [Candidatus Margulisiibacteriota bacterium]